MRLSWQCMVPQEARLAAHEDLACDDDVDPLAHGLLRIQGGDLVFALLKRQR